jgi:xanthine phosphoribosyltransferase
LEFGGEFPRVGYIYTIFLREGFVSKKKFIVSWDQFHRDSKALAFRLHEKQRNWKGIIAITRGGMIPAGIIARELDIKLVDTFGISSYDDKSQRRAKIIKDFNPDLVGKGEGWLVIDDLVDTGNTARIIRQRVPKAHVAAIYAKPKGEPVIDTYITQVSQDTWIYFPWDVDIQPMDPIVGERKQLSAKAKKAKVIGKKK